MHHHITKFVQGSLNHFKEKTERGVKEKERTGERERERTRQSQITKQIFSKCKIQLEIEIEF